MTKLKCPKCDSPVAKGGVNRNGVPRWRCHTVKGCKWNGNLPIGIHALEGAGLDKGRITALHKKLKADKRSIKRYVVTAAQNATPVNEAFLHSLLTYCKTQNAQLLVIPLRYKNPTSTWSAGAQDDDWWAPEVVPYLIDRRLELNQNLLILADIKTQPTASNPLDGFETLTAGQSAVIGHPKLELTTVATPHQKLPKILTTTGAVTEKNYIPSKAGKKAEHHHTFGACVLEVVGKTFHMRQLNAVKDGSFIDLDHEYSGATRTKTQCAGVVMGDTHEEFVDPLVVDATFGPAGLVTKLKPSYLVWHDVHDCFARNHHDARDPFINLVKHNTGLGNVEKALDKTFKFVDDHTAPGVTNVFVSSNHPNEHLGRWVRESDPRSDPENAIFWAETFVAMCRSAHMSDSGPKTVDPFIYWAKKKIRKVDQCVFLGADESMQIKGIEVGFHGHQGINGSRGSRKQYGKIGVKTVIGHSHSPGIKDGVYQVGTSSRLKLGYTHGPSSWLQTHCLIYANGKRSLVNIVGGEWRA